MMELQGKRAIVTGASRGLGRAIALEFLRQGARVTGIGRDEQALAVTREQMSRIGMDFELIRMDVTDEPAVVDLFNRVGAVDILINNAGIARSEPFLDTTTENIRRILEVNVIAPFIWSREFIRQARQASRDGYIINIASDAALIGISRMAPYVASKHALLGLGRSLIKEFGKEGIRVTTYCPGPIQTNILGGTEADLDPRCLPCDTLAIQIAQLASLPDGVEVQEIKVSPNRLY
jgi:3-hydroxybutyrate dehydrogenase